MKTAFQPANILIPDSSKTDSRQWSVVACDQYTAQPEYWEAVQQIVGDAKSTLHMIFPEVYLEQPDKEQRIQKIQETMNAYCEEGILNTYENAMVYLERTQNDGKCRCGIVGKIDLEQYDYTKGSVSPVRATEATVIERIPPRVKIREHAPIELPHIMILIDDPDGTVIEPMTAQKDKLSQLYDVDLMQNGGHLSGYLLEQPQIDAVEAALEALGNPETFREKYGVDLPVLTYAMGDGNHSLATAKACYEQMKQAHPEQDFSNHPARYALVEIVNLHSEALQFEAIHRIVNEVNVSSLLSKLTEALGLAETGDGQHFDIVENGVSRTVYVTKPTATLTVGSLQSFLDAYLKENGGKIDYIHGAEVVNKLSQQENSVGFLLPDMQKSELFLTVMQDGALPRKTFSMGHAEDKRFYYECRKIQAD